MSGLGLGMGMSVWNGIRKYVLQASYVKLQLMFMWIMSYDDFDIVGDLCFSFSWYIFTAHITSILLSFFVLNGIMVLLGITEFCSAPVTCSGLSSFSLSGTHPSSQLLAASFSKTSTFQNLHFQWAGYTNSPLLFYTLDCTLDCIDK